MITNPECLLCDYHEIDRNFFPKTINHALYSKYCSSQNYYYTKDINWFLHRKFNAETIKLQNEVCYYDAREYLKRTYQAREIGPKIENLTKYYKFHKDYAKMFMHPYGKVMLLYQNKRRRSDFKHIAKRIKEEIKRDNLEPDLEKMPYLNNKFTVIIDELTPSIL